MRRFLTLMVLFTTTIVLESCNKDKDIVDCFPGSPTVRNIVNKGAVVKINGTIYKAYLYEEGTIDTKLIPCNFPDEFYEDDLRVTISGIVKKAPAFLSNPCCAEYFVITKISR